MPNSILAGALPHTLLGEVTACPSPSSWISGDLLLREGNGRESKVRQGKGRGNWESGRGGLERGVGREERRAEGNRRGF